MGYKPRVWKPKELITAPKLNNIENAIKKEINLKFDGLYGNNKGESKMHIANVEITPNSDVNKSDITVKLKFRLEI